MTAPQTAAGRALLRTWDQTHHHPGPCISGSSRTAAIAAIENEAAAVERERIRALLTAAADKDGIMFRDTADAILAEPSE